jgi:hypothetical protein
MKTMWRSGALGVLFIALVGCGKDAFDGQSGERESSMNSADAALADNRPPGRTPAEIAVSAAAAPQAGEGGAEGIARKIVYKADVELVCDDFAAVAERLESLATSAGGFVADAQLVGSAGAPRWGVWKLRVHAGRFDGLLTEIKKLAEVRSARTTSDDVSEEYYDVEARIRNKQQEETRLLRLLDDRTAKLEEVLSVEREISRVREEVERLQARFRVLANLTELATITVRVQEVLGYQPETAATFGVRLTRSVRQSLASLLAAAQAVVIGLAVILPWIVASVIPLVTAAVFARRWRRVALMGFDKQNG